MLGQPVWLHATYPGNMGPTDMGAMTMQPIFGQLTAAQRQRVYGPRCEELIAPTTGNGPSGVVFALFRDDEQAAGRPAKKLTPKRQPA